MTPQSSTATASSAPGTALRVRGLVQGVGFRPTVWRLARDLELQGDVRNDGAGVLIRLWGPAARIAAFGMALREQCPPLARIDAVEASPIAGAPPADFAIIPSAGGTVRTGVVPDAATCAACAAEIADPDHRRYRYPFTNCTHCGPRLSIVRAIPYDRANTSMAVFPLCAACAAEYADPADRRFHAQPNACGDCGPRVWLRLADGSEPAPADLGAVDAIAAASRLLGAGQILAIKGIGGFHLACDATDAAAVAALRQRKRRAAKPFALMARDLAVIRRYGQVQPPEAALLQSPVAPVVLLDRLPPADPAGAAAIAPAVAPGQASLGWMLPYSPLHLLLLADWERPLVMTSGNRSDEPQCIDNTEAWSSLAGIADAWLLHDREIVNRVDDSVGRVLAGTPRWLRRARGLAPAPLLLPADLPALPPVLALGGELKNCIGLLKDGQVILSQHLGDLEDAVTARAFERTIELYLDLFALRPARIAVDRHPDYRSTQVGQALAAAWGVPLIPVQHHAAHLASVLADNGWPAASGPVLGLILDGLGDGGDGTVWGGELLRGDYRHWRRLGHLRPVPLPGGQQAIRAPWRNLYAQLATCLGWAAARARWGHLRPLQALAARPLGVLEQMCARGLGAPASTSAGRLFDAVAAALDICFDGIAYEGQAAIELETAARQAGPAGPGYPFAIRPRAERLVLDPAPMWTALLDDLAAGVPAGTIAARFHAGLATALGAWLRQAARAEGIETVALSGGVFQNRTLFEALLADLQDSGLQVLSHRQVPCNDGGLALGQAVLAALAEAP
ncbi:MAG: carbamoyltransferase HypF [Chromatiaceae bacterium]|nr:MAG: carbamoyltransferase HypF [Chromatiaceae bacterium]